MTGPTKATRQGVLTRARMRCERCARVLSCGYSIHHRRPRGMGGSHDEMTNTPANLVVLCGHATTPGGCHLWVEAHRTAARDEGFLVRSGTDPATVPVCIRLVPGTRPRQVYLRMDFTYEPVGEPQQDEARP